MHSVRGRSCSTWYARTARRVAPSSLPVGSTPRMPWAWVTADPELPVQTVGCVELRGAGPAGGHGSRRGRLVGVVAGCPANTWHVPWSTGQTRPVQNDVWARAPFHDSEMW